MTLQYIWKNRLTITFPYFFVCCLFCFILLLPEVGPWHLLHSDITNVMKDGNLWLDGEQNVACDVSQPRRIFDCIKFKIKNFVISNHKHTGWNEIAFVWGSGSNRTNIRYTYCSRSGLCVHACRHLVFVGSPNLIQ